MAPKSEMERQSAVRTALSNERTLLAYVRTALALFLTGASLIAFLHHPGAFWTGWAIVAASVALLAIGFVRYLTVRRRWQLDDDEED